MPYSIFLPLPFQLSAISFPLHNLQIESSPIRLNHEYYSDLFLNDFLLIIPECFGILSVFIVLLYGVFFSDRKGEKRFDVAVHDLNKQDLGGILGVNSSWIAILSIAFTILLFLNNPISNASVLYSCFLLDDFGLFLKILVLVATLFSIVISLQYLEREKLNNFELQTIILISSIMMLFLISSVDFISIYLAIECQSLCFYVMAGMKRESEFSTEAGLKYFLLGAFSSGILLFGFALQYGFTGTTNFSELSKIFLSIHDAWGDSSVALVEQASQDTASVLPGISSFFSTPSLSASTNDFQQITELTPLATKRGCELGMIFILVGFLFKVSAVPFHMWAPDVYEGAPTSVTAFFAIVPKISIFAICLRLCYGASYGFILSWQKILILSSILSMVVGSFAALAQNKVKRLLAWSSIGHVGFILTALGCGTIEGSQAVVFYLVIYVIMTIALFQIILLPLRREKINSFLFSRKISDKKDSSYIAKGVPQEVLRSKPKSGGQIATFDDLDESDNRAIKYTTDLAFLSQTYPVIAMTIMVTMFSIAGIPPLAGFWSKAFLLFAAMSAKQFVLAIIVILTSVISCFYYIRIVKIMYFEAQLPKWRTASKEKSQTSVLTFMPISKESCLVWGIMVALLIFFCFNATALFKATHFISLSLA